MGQRHERLAPNNCTYFGPLSKVPLLDPPNVPPLVVWHFKGRILFLQSRLKRHSPESTAFSSFWVAITYGGRGLAASQAAVLKSSSHCWVTFFHSFGEEVDGKNWARER